MINFNYRYLVAGFAAMAAFVYAGPDAVGQQATAGKVVDPAKTGVIEPSIKNVVRGASAPANKAGQEFVNPHVKPGLIRWHATFADACKAAAKSRKPVLLFQMMGKLDDLFC